MIDEKDEEVGINDLDESHTNIVASKTKPRVKTKPTTVKMISSNSKPTIKTQIGYSASQVKIRKQN
jgi:hypothetical protein